MHCCCKIVKYVTLLWCMLIENINKGFEWKILILIIERERAKRERERKKNGLRLFYL